MPFDWRGFLIVAHSLRNNYDEGALRTCLSRIYYYLFNLGLIKARQMNFKEHPPELHRKLWDWCQKSSDAEINSLGLMGNRLKSLRIQADYRVNPIQHLAAEVQDQLANARMFEAIIAKKNGVAPPPALKP